MLTFNWVRRPKTSYMNCPKVEFIMPPLRGSSVYRPDKLIMSVVVRLLDKDGNQPAANKNVAIGNNFLGTIDISRFDPAPAFVSKFLVLRIGKNLHFLTPPHSSPPTSANVIYKWSLRFAMVNITNSAKQHACQFIYRFPLHQKFYS